MTIEYRYFDGRYTHYLSAEVKRVTEYKGHEILKDDNGWYYVFCHDNWEYFGTMREAKRFINTTYWN